MDIAKLVRLGLILALLADWIFLYADIQAAASEESSSDKLEQALDQIKELQKEVKLLKQNIKLD